MNAEKYRTILLDTDSYELNPLLDPDRRGMLSVRGVRDDGQEAVIPNENLYFHIRTIFTCDDAKVITVSENGEVTGLHGGLVRISAEYLCGGQGILSNEIEMIVRPFYCEYHKALTFKLFLAMEPYGSLWKEPEEKRDASVFLDLDETLDLICRLDAITCGMPKILYLVGWQRGGHDHLYPSFAEANPRLRRPGDRNAAESIRWLMREAKRYHTSVSLHINLIDAWEDSPLWELYREKHILAEDENGGLLNPGADFDEFKEKYGIRVGRVQMTRLWDTGEFQKRMEELFALFPELSDSHTVHIDNWRCEPCPGLGITKTDEENAMRKMFCWLRERGFDATSEGAFHGRTEPMTGFQPMSWFDTPYSPDMMPNSLYCGGRRKRTDSDPRFGDTIQVEGAVRENLRRGRDTLSGIQDEYCLYTLPWEFLNHFRLLSFDGTTAEYTDGVRAVMKEGLTEIYWNETRIRTGTTMFVPLLFKEDREIVLYSFRDTYYVVKLPVDWKDVRSVDLFYIDPLGRHAPTPEYTAVPIKDGQLHFAEETRCAYLVKPHND